MIRVVAAALGLTLAATPALATEWIDCVDAGMNASVSLLTGSGLDVLALVAARLDLGDSHWVTDPVYAEGEGVQPMVVGQAYEDAETLRVDLMSEDMSARIGEVRLFKAEGLDGVVMSGTLAGIGRGAWAIACTGP